VNGIHDLGGMHGFGPIRREDNEPVFHAEWEGRLFAIRIAMTRGGHWNVDEGRRSTERMPPARYLAASYYERWLYGLESLLLEKKVVTPDELASHLRCVSEPCAVEPPAERPKTEAHPNHSAAASHGSPSSSHAHILMCDEDPKAKFKPGDLVVARNINPPGHTRLPRYARGRRGIVRRVWGMFAFPDTNAHGLGANRQHCYSVEFSGSELWGDGHRSAECVYLDLWEDYLTECGTGLSLSSQGAQAKPEPTHKERADDFTR
jgi:nitrile hydratase